MKKVIYQNLFNRQGMKHVLLEGPAGHWVAANILPGGQAYRVKLFNRRDFWRDLF